MRLRIAIMSMIALACATEIAVAGPLPSDFGQKLVMAAIVFVLIYLVYPITAAVCWLLWRRGKRALSIGLASALLIVGFVFPAVHQRAYFSDHAHIQQATVIPEKLDLSGKTVLVVANACFDLCETLLTHADLDGLYQKYMSGEVDKDFIKKGLLAPKEGHLWRLTLGANRMRRNDVPSEELAKVDYIIYKDLYSTMHPSLSGRIGTDVAQDQLGIRYLMAPVQDINVMTIDQITPDLLVFYSKAKSYKVPLHPAQTVREPVLSYGMIDTTLARLFCPEPNVRLRFVCKPRHSPNA